MCVRSLLRVAFFFWARPRKTGDTECSEQGGASHEREQSTKTHLRKSVPMRDQPLVRWSVLRRSRQGESRWARFVREARPGGQAGRADRVLGRDALSHRSVVQGGQTAREARRSGATAGSARAGYICNRAGLRRTEHAQEDRHTLESVGNLGALRNLGKGGEVLQRGSLKRGPLPLPPRGVQQFSGGLPGLRRR